MNALRSAVALTVSALCCAGCGADVEPHITASNPVVGAVPGDSAAVYVELENSGGDDALIGATCDCDAEISLHVTEDLDGISIMTGADRLDVPTGSTLELDPQFGSQRSETVRLHPDRCRVRIHDASLSPIRRTSGAVAPGALTPLVGSSGQL